MSEKKIILSTKYWDYTCGDGCCYEHGEDLLVNGAEVGNVYADTLGTIQSLLEHLGYEVEWAEEDEE